MFEPGFYATGTTLLVSGQSGLEICQSSTNHTRARQTKNPDVCLAKRFPQTTFLVGMACC